MDHGGMDHGGMDHGEGSVMQCMGSMSMLWNGEEHSSTSMLYTHTFEHTASLQQPTTKIPASFIQVCSAVVKFTCS